MMARNPFTQCLCIVVTQVSGFLRSEILFLVGMEVFFHLPDDMLGLVVIYNLKVRWCFYHFMRMPAMGTEFPFLEMIHVRKRPA